MAVAKRGDQAQVIQSIRYKLKNSYQRHLTSVFPRCRATSREQQAPQPLALAEVSEHAFRRRCHARLYGTITFCPVFSKNFNITSAPFVHQPLTLRKKSILAKVCFDAKGG